MTATLLPQGRQKYFDDNGNVLAGGKIYTFSAGTSTPQAAYQDADGTIPHTNPIILDAEGEAVIFWSGNYKINVKTSADVQVSGWPVDNVRSDPLGVSSVLASLNAFIASLASTVGSSLVGFLQAGAGAVLRTLQSKGRDIKNMADWGVVGDGVTTDTLAWQAAIDAVSAAGGGLLYVNRGTYLLGKWYMKNNVTLILCPGTTLQCINNILAVNDRFVNIDGVSNWGIEGNWARVRMNKEYASGEQRHAVFMVDAHNGFIRNLKANDSGGDGYYIGRNAPGTHCTDILLDNCYADNNRRNNLSIVSGARIIVRGGLYSNVSGTAPQYGVDVEPNDSDDVLEAIELINVRTSGNANGGFILAMSNFVLTANRKTSISMVGCKSFGDNTANASAGSSLRITGNLPTWVNSLIGQITVVDFDSFDCNGPGILIQDWDYQKGAHISIDRARVSNPNAGNAMVQPFDKCGVSALNFSGPLSVGNFTLNDIRVSGANVYAAFLTYDVGGAIRNFSAKDVIGETVGSSGYKNYFSVNGPNLDSSITYSQEEVVSVTASGGIRQYVGQVIETPSGGAFTLDVNAADSTGHLFTFRNPANVTTQIVPSGSDPILGWSVGTGAAGALIMNRTGDLVKLRGTPQGWSPEYVSHYAQRPIATNTTVPRKIVWGTAAPTSGTWEQGDRLFNISATVGQPKSFVCTVSGTPGTWVSEGNL